MWTNLAKFMNNLCLVQMRMRGQNEWLVIGFKAQRKIKRRMLGLDPNEKRRENEKCE